MRPNSPVESESRDQSCPVESSAKSSHAPVAQPERNPTEIETAKDTPAMQRGEAETIPGMQRGEADDVRNKRPSNRDEIATLQELLAPSRRAFVKLCGKLAPSTPLSESYLTQFAVLQHSFKQQWSSLYKDVGGPQLPSMLGWKGTILDLRYSGGSGSKSIILRFDAFVDSKIGAIMGEMKKKGRGPFFEPAYKAPTRGVSFRVQKANAFNIIRRRPVFVHRPSFANASVSQIDCLQRLHQDWKRKVDGVESGDAIVPEQSDETGNRFVNQVLHSRPDQFARWLRTVGGQLYEQEWQELMTFREYGEWIAPIAFAAAVYDNTTAEMQAKQDFLGPGAEASTAAAHSPQDFGQAAVSRSGAIRGRNVFMGSMYYETREWQNWLHQVRLRHNRKIASPHRWAVIGDVADGRIVPEGFINGGIVHGGIANGEIISGELADGIFAHEEDANQEDSNEEDASGEIANGENSNGDEGNANEASSRTSGGGLEGIAEI